MGIVYWVVLAVGLMLVLAALGVNITPLFALIGGISFIAAFAMQDTLSNLASGLLIMIYRPFDRGDYVDTGGVSGTVTSVNIVATTVVTPDNKVIVIPNKNVWGNIITNVTASDTRRVDLVFGISYDDPIPEAIRVMEETVEAHPLVLKEPAPTIRVNELADSSVNFHLPTVGEDARLLDRVLGSDAGREGAFRRRRHFDTLSATRRALHRGRASTEAWALRRLWQPKRGVLLRPARVSIAEGDGGGS